MSATEPRTYPETSRDGHRLGRCGCPRCDLEKAELRARWRRQDHDLAALERRQLAKRVEELVAELERAKADRDRARAHRDEALERNLALAREVVDLKARDAGAEAVRERDALRATLGVVERVARRRRDEAEGLRAELAEARDDRRRAAGHHAEAVRERDELRDRVAEIDRGRAAIEAAAGRLRPPAAGDIGRVDLRPKRVTIHTESGMPWAFERPRSVAFEF